jgi:hypothetical protein
MSAGGVRRRLENLEERAWSSGQEAEERVSREVMRRLTDGELDAYADALRRMLDGEETAPGDEAILARIQELREEVTSGHQTTPR